MKPNKIENNCAKIDEFCSDKWGEAFRAKIILATSTVLLWVICLFKLLKSDFVSWRIKIFEISKMTAYYVFAL